MHWFTRQQSGVTPRTSTPPAPLQGWGLPLLPTARSKPALAMVGMLAREQGEEVFTSLFVHQYLLSYPPSRRQALLWFWQAPAERSPGDHSSAGSSRLSLRGAQKRAVLAGSTSEALCYRSPCPAAPTGISSRSLRPRHPLKTQGGWADSGQGRQEGISRSGGRQVTQSLRQPRVQERSMFSVFAFEKWFKKG